MSNEKISPIEQASRGEKLKKALVEALKYYSSEEALIQYIDMDGNKYFMKIASIDSDGVVDIPSATINADGVMAIHSGTIDSNGVMTL